MWFLRLDIEHSMLNLYLIWLFPISSAVFSAFVCSLLCRPPLRAVLDEARGGLDHTDRRLSELDTGLGLGKSHVFYSEIRHNRL